MESVSEHNAIWVASYPKSGNTWMMLALQAYFRGGYLDSLEDRDQRSGLACSLFSFEENIGLEASDMTLEEILEYRPDVLETQAPKLLYPKAIKTHDQATLPNDKKLFPVDGTRSVLHLVRDPRDVAISLANHTGDTIDLTIEKLQNKGFMASSDNSGARQLPQYIGSWSQHCQSWMDEANRLPVLTMRYEDRLANPEETFLQTIRFLKLQIDQDLLKRVIGLTSFNRLKKLEEENGFSERPTKSKSFFKSGKSQLWKEILTPKQIARIEKDHGEMMHKLGYLK